MINASASHRYTPGQIIRLLNDWSRFADTLAPAAPPSGYGAALGRAAVPDFAAFERLAGLYADLDAALGPGRPGQVVRLYFRGLIDTDPASRTYGLYVRRGFAGVRAALRCGIGEVGPLLRAGVRDLLVQLAGLPEPDAEAVLAEWWEKRNYGWARARQ